MAAYNSALQATFAALPNVAVVDLNRATGLCNANDSPMRRLCAECNGGAACVTNATFYDRVHPTAAGYSVMAGAIAAALTAAY